MTNELDRTAHEYVMFTEGDWILTDEVKDLIYGSPLTGARMWHKCLVYREAYQSPYDTLRGKCWNCLTPVPTNINAIWSLYNFDKIHFWRDAGDAGEL